MLTAGMLGLLWIHPKIGSTLRSQEDGLGQWVSPLMSPFAWAKTKVLNDFEWFSCVFASHSSKFFIESTQVQGFKKTIISKALCYQLIVRATLP